MIIVCIQPYVLFTGHEVMSIMCIYNIVWLFQILTHKKNGSQIEIHNIEPHYFGARHFLNPPLSTLGKNY